MGTIGLLKNILQPTGLYKKFILTTKQYKNKIRLQYATIRVVNIKSST